jgi:NCAIR mutase (PurE)-related protein
LKPDHVKAVLESLSRGALTPDEAYRRLKHLPFEELGFATLDHHRALRRGFPEVIYCEGKSPDEVSEIAAKMAEAGGDVLGTRCPPETFERVRGAAPGAVYHERGRVFVLRAPPAANPPERGRVVIVAAGTSDLPVVEEARVSAETLGLEVEQIVDVGVAGLHRLLPHRESLGEAEVVIVVAGMEGALASVVGGLVDVPVIAVPTSVGYGASFEGLAALLAMLNSCASGVTVVNIDNGFGAAVAAAMICRGARRLRPHGGNPGGSS